MDYDRIIGLLDKYWKCETTLPEEEELRYFYKHCRQMPEELAEYRELFIFQEGERQIGLGNDFDRKILASIYNKRPAGWRKGLRVAAVRLGDGSWLLCQLRVDALSAGDIDQTGSGHPVVQVLLLGMKA